MTKHAKFHRIWHGKFDICQTLKISVRRRSTDAQRFNLLGKRVIMEENQAQIDIAGLMSGVYILTVRHNGNIYTNKIIIE